VKDAKVYKLFYELITSGMEQSGVLARPISKSVGFSFLHGTRRKPRGRWFKSISRYSDPQDLTKAETLFLRKTTSQSEAIKVFDAPKLV